MTTQPTPKCVENCSGGKVADNVYRKILGVSRRASASGMFVSNDIPNFEAFLRKSIYSFTTRLSSSSNKLIGAIEQSWIMKSLVWKTWDEKMYI